MKVRSGSNIGNRPFAGIAAKDGNEPGVTDATVYVNGQNVSFADLRCMHDILHLLDAGSTFIGIVLIYRSKFEVKRIMSTFVFKINSEHCPENAFDRRESDLWKAGEFKVPWPKALENRKLHLNEIRRGDECWIWLHVARRKEKNRRSPGLVGWAVIDHVAPTEEGLLLVKFSRVEFRKTAVLRKEFEQHQERSNTVKNLLKYTTRRVLALSDDQVEDFEHFVDWLDDGEFRQIRRLQGQNHSHQDQGQTDETEYTLDKNHEVSIENRTDIGPTEKQSLQKARRGQGIFRKNVKEIERACRVTGVDDARHLRASHIKPWRTSSDFEKLDGSNGLLLSPHVDHLFDQGFISFADTGELLISTELAPDVLEGWGISAGTTCGDFRETQRVYLAYHRNQVFKRQELSRFTIAAKAQFNSTCYDMKCCF